MKIVFTGASGLLGKYFLRNLKKGYQIIGTCNRDFPNRNNFFKVDIIDKKLLTNFIEHINPAIIIHAASLGNVDYCEKNPEEAFKVNIEGTKNIIEAAEAVNAKIIFLSSNAIFDGKNPPYNEKSAPNPIDIYGKTKIEGEKLIQKSGLRFVILRLITMYGWPNTDGRGNPVTWVIDNLRKGRKINVVDDIYNNHLWAGQAAEVLWKIIKKNIVNDLFNIGGKDSISRFDLANKVAKIFKLDSSLISSVTSDFFKGLAKRPKNTTFDTKKMEKILGIKALSIEKGLRVMKKETKYFL